MATSAQTAGFPPYVGGLERSVRLSWVGLIATIGVVVMFIPIRRYTLPGGLPFELEPYRLLVAVIVAGWIVALLVDPDVRLRRTGLRAPLLVLLGGVLGSIAVNHVAVAGEQTQVIKSLTFLLSFIVLLVLIVSVVHTREAVDRLLAVLVGSGSVVAVCAIVESRTGFNAFNDLQKIAPFLTLDELPETPGRGARLRVFASAQHPIALSAAMVMLAPLGGYLAVRRRRWTWWVATGLLLMAAVATLSRTGVLMLLVMLVVFAVLRPREARRLLPIAIPLLLAVHLSLPGALGSLKSAFAPEGGLVNEQTVDAGKVGSGRIADLGPSIDQFKRNPVLGEGFGTRIVEGAQHKAKVLDNQWLGTLLETGLVGVLGWLWFLGRTVRRLGRQARGDPSDRGLLTAALAGSIAAFAVGLFTYDAFSFIQVTYLMFILVALSVVLLLENPTGARARRSPWR